MDKASKKSNPLVVGMSKQRAFSDPTMRRKFFKRDRDARQKLGQFLKYVGYGLYVSRKF